MISKLSLFFVFVHWFVFSTASAVAVVSQAENVARCYFCASPVFESYWGASGFSQKPSNIPFSYECYTRPLTVSVNSSTTETSVCTKMDRGCVELIMDINGERAAIRGCLLDFYSSGDDVDLTNNTCTYTTLIQSDKTSSFVAANFCKTNATDQYACNGYLDKDTTYPDPAGRCTSATDRKCTACSRFGDQGKCKHNSGGECTGPWCTKTSGKFGDTEFEVRGCGLNPLNANVTKSTLPGVLAIPGTTMNEKMEYTTYYCKNADHCNFSPQTFSFIIFPFIFLAYFV